MVGEIDGETVSLKVVGGTDGDSVGSEVIDGVDGETMGAEVVGGVDCKMVGPEVVDEMVGPEVVVDWEGKTVGCGVGSGNGGEPACPKLGVGQLGSHDGMTCVRIMSNRASLVSSSCVRLRRNMTWQRR